MRIINDAPDGLHGHLYGQRGGRPHMIAVEGFDWDEGNRDKCHKHGVSLAEIEALFHGTPRVAPDIRHSVAEQRFIAVGRNGAGRPLFVAFTLREAGGQRLIRPISARYMHAEEARRYEEAEGGA
jgi:uncharacterized DUF497 family protein